MQLTQRILREDERNVRLPPVAEDKLAHIEAAAAGARTAAAAASERLRGLLRLGDKLETELVLAQSGGPGGARVSAESVRQVERAREIHNATVQKHSRQSSGLDDHSEGMARPLNAIRSWLDDLGSRPIYPHIGEIQPKLLPKETRRAAILRTRAEIDERRADLHRIASAPIPTTEAKVLLRAELAQLAASGAPDVSRCLEGGGVRWPSAEMHAGDGALISRAAFDPKALIVWLNHDAILAKLEAEIDAEHDPSAALTAEQRFAEDKRVRAEILRLEREEEALIEDHGAGNDGIYRREDADPRAVLGLSDDLPAPSEAF